MSLPSVHTELPVLQETEFAYYKDGYRYQLVRPFCAKTKIRPARVILTEWIILTPGLRGRYAEEIRLKRSINGFHNSVRLQLQI
jgi:hypothetical protein